MDHRRALHRGDLDHANRHLQPLLAGAYGPAAAAASLLILATTISLVLFTLIGGNDDRLTV